MTQPATTCTVCGRIPLAVNNEHCECSMVDCPHRRRAWSERPDPLDFLPRADEPIKDVDDSRLSALDEVFK